MLRKYLLIAMIAMALGACSSSDKNTSSEPNLSEDINQEIAEEAELGQEDLIDEDIGEDSQEEEAIEEEIAEDDELGSEEEDFLAEDGEEEFSLDDFEEEDFAEEDLEDELEEGFEDSDEDLLAENNEEEQNQVALEEETFTTDNIAQEVAAMPNRVQGLDFLANKNGGTILISTLKPASFRQRKNLATGQFIIEVDNVDLPAKFRRPYDTREFNGSIGLFQAYQDEGSRTARFVIQTKEGAEPLITQEGEALMILAQNPVTEMPVAANQNITPSEDLEFENSRITVDQAAIARDKEVLKEKSVEDFLTGNTNYYGKKINIELVNTDIIQVFNILAEQSNLNIIVAEGVSGNITLRLREIPWDQALMVVLQSKQLGYTKNGNILRIAPLKTIEREANDARAVIEAQKKLLPVKVRIFPISFATASDIATQVKDFLTEGRGKATADTRTNSLVVTDLPEVLDKVQTLIRRLDTETPQVLMEAKFVEATEEFGRQLNLNLTGASYTNGDTTGTFTGLSTTASASLSVSFNSFSNLGSMNALLGLFEDKNIARVISSPRVIGLNNETATISQTTQVLDQSTTVVSGDAATSTTTFTPRDLTLSLSMTPQITAEGSVLMEIQVQRDVAGEQVTSSDGASSRPVGTRSANTKVLVANGDTVVIGGVYQYDKSQVEQKVPLLGDIPVLGYLFKTKTTSSSKNELMIFVTPRVLNIDRAFSKGDVFTNGQATDELSPSPLDNSSAM